MQQEVSSIFPLPKPRRVANFPPLNIHSGDEDVIITSEIPGIDPADVELTVTGDTLSIKGTRKPHEVKEGETWHRRERGSGDFFRTVQLPFNVDAGKVQAEYVNGVLRIVLPRAEADKPRKISVTPGN
ncbi:MAG TPA: Hsp20/alpha crystallin family protein [Desulfomonilia bacterium]|jgi:HSP20 family protein|nr:Hsp20/alpha crystallin family protein [Thermodesulfobacteriota bacterium]HWR68442.1 Hsp20/alpha crystallin family protein [Desulfomonilia bacterium]